jgi:hypothetical protein
MKIKLNWVDFKGEVSDRAMNPQWVDANDSYYICAKDDFFQFNCELEQDEGSDVVDFEVNYKDSWNRALEYHDRNGLKRFHTSPRPNGTITYFAGGGDNGGVGNGADMVFDITSGDTEVSKILSFSEDVNVKDGIVITKNAPLGSKISVEILDPSDNVVMTFVKKVNLLGSQTIYLNSEDSELLYSYLKLKVTVYNGITPVDFQVVGNIEMYRTNTV